MNIYSEIKACTHIYQDKPALEIRLDNGEYRSYTYGQILESVEKYTECLLGSGIIKGDRIALIAENSPEWVISFLSIAKAECTAVLIDPSLPDAALDDFIKRSDVRSIMVSPKIEERLTVDLPAFNICNKAALFDGSGSILQKNLPATIDPDSEVAAIMYSSGTTSTAKGVMHCHDRLLTMADINIKCDCIVDKDRLLAVIPLYHIYGFLSKLLCPLLCGATVCYLESPASESLVKAFEEFRPTGFCCVPRVYGIFKSRIIDTVRSKGMPFYILFNIMLAGCTILRSVSGVNAGRYLFKSIHNVYGGCIRGFMSGGAPIDSGTMRFFYGLGFLMLNNYGLTETSLPVTANTVEKFYLDTCGRTHGGVQIKFGSTDSTGSGEILVKSPGMMKGYFRDEEATRAAFDRDGWLMTGDTGYLDKHGDLIVTGRVKENIVLQTGKKLSPADVESKYEGICGVKEFVVCGVPVSSNSYDEIHGFIVKDEAIPRDNAEIEADTRDAGAKLPHYMRVGKIHFINDIPKTALQKPKRYLLKQMVLDQEHVVYTPEVKGKTSDRKENYEKKYDIVLKIASKLNFSNTVITGNTRLIEDLGFDSLTITEFCTLLEKETGKNIAHLLKPNITLDEIIRSLDKNEKILYMNVCDLDRFPGKRRIIDSVVYNITKTLSKLLYRFEVKGLDNLPEGGGFILCPNHETHLDGLWILMHLPRECYHRFCCMAKIEHLNNPMGRLMLRIAGGIPVDRQGNPGPAYQRCLDKLKEGFIVLVHPEGTRTSDGIMGEFKKGASKLSVDSRLPIVPVMISGGYDIYPKNRKLPRLFNAGKMRRYSLSIAFGKPIMPHRYNIENLTHELRSRVVNLKAEVL